MPSTIDSPLIFMQINEIAMALTLELQVYKVVGFVWP